MKKLEPSQVISAIADNLGGIDEEELAKLYADYAEPDGVLWDHTDGCFWQPETEDEAIRTVTIFELLDDGRDVPMFLGSVRLPPCKTLNDLQRLYSEWEQALAKQEAMDGNDDLEVSEDFVEWLKEKHGFSPSKEAEGFAYLRHE